MRSDLFTRENHEIPQDEQRFVRQNPQMLRVSLDQDILATKGSMVAYQGEVEFQHEGSGSVGKFLRRVVSSEDVPLMRVSGDGQVFFASEAGFVYIIELDDEGISINGTSLLAFDASLDWDVQRVQGLGTLSGGAFNTVIRGTGSVALAVVGQPVVLSCSPHPTYVDVNAVVGWSASLTPSVVSSMNMRSMLRGGTGESFQYAFSGPGFVIVQPSEGATATQQGAQPTQSGGVTGMLGDLLR